MDPVCIKFAQWGEEVLLGKREFSSTINDIRYTAVRLVQRSHSNGVITVNDMEKGSS